MLHQQL